MHSVQAPLLNLALIGAWQQTPEDLRAYIPSWAAVTVLCVILVLGVVGRLIKQDLPEVPEKKSPQLPDPEERL